MCIHSDHFVLFENCPFLSLLIVPSMLAEYFEAVTIYHVHAHDDPERKAIPSLKKHKTSKYYCVQTSS